MDVEDLLGRPVHQRVASAPADRATADAALAAVGLPPPDSGEALPAVLLPVWSRPTCSDGELPLRLHFELKDHFGLPDGVMSGCVTTYLGPVAPGDLLRTVEVLRDVGDERETRLGVGRRWVIEVEHRNQHGVLVGVESWTGVGYRPDLGAAPAALAPVEPSPPASKLLEHELTVSDVVAASTAAREWRPVHLDPAAARAAGLPDVILGTTGQQLWLWRAVVGSRRRATPSRLDLRMRAPITPGPMAISRPSPADAGAEFELVLSSAGALATTARFTLGGDGAGS